MHRGSSAEIETAVDASAAELRTTNFATAEHNLAPVGRFEKFGSGKPVDDLEAGAAAAWASWCGHAVIVA